jgi:hypothetical protein
MDKQTATSWFHWATMLQWHHQNNAPTASAYIARQWAILNNSFASIDNLPVLIIRHLL